MKIGMNLSVVLLLAAPAMAQKSKVERPWVLVKGKPVKGAEPQGEAKTAQELVDDGLKWLVKKQAPDGRWTRSGKGKLDDEEDVIPTAQAVLAFLGNGHTHRFGKTKKTVAGGLRFLKAAGKRGWGKKSDAPVLAEALRVQALAEAYMITRDFSLKPALESAVPTLLALASPQGGYGFEPKGPPNSLATALVTLTFKTFKVGGIEVPDRAFSACRDFLTRCTGPDGLTGFSAPGQGISLGARSTKRSKKKRKYAKVPLFTAGALIARIFCGERRTEPALKALLKRLSLPHPDRREPLYWYLCTYSTFMALRSSQWEGWQSALRTTLTAERKADGSWGSSGVMGKLGGAAGTTAVNIQAAEVVLRYERARR